MLTTTTECASPTGLQLSVFAETPSLWRVSLLRKLNAFKLFSILSVLILWVREVTHILAGPFIRVYVYYTRGI